MESNIEEKSLVSQKRKRTLDHQGREFGGIFQSKLKSAKRHQSTFLDLQSESVTVKSSVVDCLKALKCI